MIKAIQLRNYTASDLDAVVTIFTESVHRLSKDYYDARQREAWAPRPPVTSAWCTRLDGLQTVIAEVDGEIIGFIAYQLDGHIDLLFVSPAFQGQGVAFGLYREVEARLARQGVSELYTEASLLARPFFERQGFGLVEEQRVTRGGVTLRRYLMQKHVRQ